MRIEDASVRLYHKDIFWKSYFDRASGRLIYNKDIDFSYHICEQKFGYDARHNFSLMKLAEIIFNIRNNNQYYWIYEIATVYDKEKDSEHIVKVVIRTHYDDIHDISIVFTEYYIITAWLNNKRDTHTTLNKHKYYYPKKCVDK